MKVIAGTVPKIDKFPPGTEVAWTDEWKRSKLAVAITVAGPCLVVVAHNAATKDALAGHFSAPAGDRGKKLPEYGPIRYVGMDKFHEMLPVIRQLGALAQTTIWCGGHGVEYDGIRYPEAEVAYERKYVTTHLNRAAPGAKILPPQWTNTPNTELLVLLTCADGV